MDLINQDGVLKEVCTELRDEVLCLDTEFVRRSTFYPILALVQFADNEQSWLVDAPQIGSWQPLVQTMQAKTVVMHSASEDLEVFRNSMDSLPHDLFDTQVAAAFVGMGSALSYAALVEKLLGITLEKSQTQSDWLRRPLSEAQKSYAREDVLYLKQIYEILMDLLVKQGKLPWMQAHAKHTLLAAADLVDPEMAYLKVKGAGNLRRDQLELLASLAAWRERQARELNKPRNWLIRDAEMVKAARLRPVNRSDLDKGLGMSHESIRRYGSEILALVADPPEVQLADLPPPNLEGRDRALVKQLQERVSEMAEHHQIAERLIANRSELEALVRYQRGEAEAPQMISDWRSDIFTPRIQELVNAG